MLDAGHVPVMCPEVMECLAPRPGQVMVDCTAGRGGHAEALARAVGVAGTVVLFDRDAGNLASAEARLRSLPDAPTVMALHANFERIGEELAARSLRAEGVLADLGFASTQMDDPERGFAFSRPGPLDMRLDRSRGPTAAELLAGVDEGELADLIYDLGEDPFSRRIARSIMERRATGTLKTTQDLAEAVVRAYGPRARHSRMHPATRTFMAIRIAVNRELESLDNYLAAIAKAGALAGTGQPTWLAPDARVAILSFHSLEDRSIKRAMVEWERHGWATRLHRKPMVASESEQRQNPRSRSAKLRAIRVQPRTEESSRQGW
jgi:16S rRNA (cytosine1402-N4)-methyltransferase